MTPRNTLHAALQHAACARPLLAALFLLSGAFLWPRPASSASARQLSLEEMVGLADEIVVGHVVTSDARWQGKLIVTVATVEVSESLKGHAGSRIDVTLLGGTAVHPTIGAPVTMTASEETSLRAGEDVLLFVRQAKPGAENVVRQLVGGAQGKFVIRVEPTGARSLPVGPKQLRVLREDDRHTVAAEAMTLDGMRARIRACLEQQAPTGGTGK